MQKGEKVEERRYLRVLQCPYCESVCELVGEPADSWECTNCDRWWGSTDDEIERYREKADCQEG